MKILVTGGAGFIGSHVSDAYIKDGHQVLIIDDLSTGTKENINSSADFFQGDILSKQVHQKIIEWQPEVINHHAAHIHVGKSVDDPQHDANINIFGTLNILNAAKESKSVKHIIFASTGGAMYGDKPLPFNETMIPQPLSPYGISKRASELYLYFYQNQFGITYTSLRYANVYGPRQNPHGEAGVISIFFNTLNAGNQPIINGDGKQTRDYVFVADVAAANVAALEKRVSGEFNIGTGIETDVNEIFNLVVTSCNKTDVIPLHEPERFGEQRQSSLNANKAKQLLGIEPSETLKEGIEKTAKFFLI